LEFRLAKNQDRDHLPCHLQEPGHVQVLGVDIGGGAFRRLGVTSFEVYLAGDRDEKSALGKGPKEEGCHLLAVDRGVRAVRTHCASLGDARQRDGVYMRFVKGPGIVAEVVGW
jgi:hypothetical protein